MSIVSKPYDIRDDMSLDELVALTTTELLPSSRKLTIAEMQADARASDKRTSVSAYQHILTTSDNLRPSRAYRDEQVSALVNELIAARAARGHRKAMRRPTRRRGQRDLFDIVRLHLSRLCRRVLNDRCLRGHPLPSEAMLADAVETYVTTELHDLIYFHEYGEQREPQRVRRTYLDNSRDAVEKVSASAAHYALSTWTPDFIADMQQLGSRGGRISKRKPAWNETDLDRLAAMNTMTVVQQAEAFGTSASTIDRMRRALRERS